jgi:hypothetical protein
MYCTLGDQFHFNVGDTDSVSVYSACKCTVHHEAFRKLLQNAVPQVRRNSHNFRNFYKVLFLQLSPILIKRDISQPGESQSVKHIDRYVGSYTVQRMTVNRLLN